MKAAISQCSHRIISMEKLCFSCENRHVLYSKFLTVAEIIGNM